MENVGYGNCLSGFLSCFSRQLCLAVARGGALRARQQRCVCFEVCLRRAGARAFLAGGPRAADLAVGAKGARESRGSWEGRWGLPKWWWRPAELQSDVQERLLFL